MPSQKPNMKLHYARITQHGQTFAVVRVQPAFLQDRAKAEQAILWLQTRYFQMPTALMACDNHGAPQAYYGRGDLALALIRTPCAAVAWQEAVIS
jgi:hypothetical protein